MLLEHLNIWNGPILQSSLHLIQDPHWFFHVSQVLFQLQGLIVDDVARIWNALVEIEDMEDVVNTLQC